MARDGNLDFTRSVSQRAMYRECPRKWMLRYMLGYKQKGRKAAWVFGDVMEAVCNAILLGYWEVTKPGENGAKPVILFSSMLQTVDDAIKLFDVLWGPARMDGELVWSKKMSWGMYRDRGRVLVRKVWEWIPVHLDRTPGTFTLQDEIRYTIGPAAELCYLDFIGNGRKEADQPFSRGILDFKTATQRESECFLELDEQLTTYQVGAELKYPGQSVNWLAHLRMVAVTEPWLQVLWVPPRDQEVIQDFMAGAIHTNRDILQGNFTRNTSQCHKWGGCWGQPVCFPSQRERVAQELVRDEKKDQGEGAAAAEIEL